MVYKPVERAVMSVLKGPTDLSVADGERFPLAAAEPIQVDLDHPISAMKDGWRLDGVARYDITAVVLSKRSYWFDYMSDLSPLDLALGWGSMSIPSLIEDVSISQSGRFYFWSFGGRTGLSKEDVAPVSANVHIIPANSEVAHLVAQIREGDVVRLQGFLVDLTSPEGGVIRSSRTRNDTGAGACEVFLVTGVDLDPPPGGVIVRSHYGERDQPAQSAKMRIDKDGLI